MGEVTELHPQPEKLDPVDFIGPSLEEIAYVAEKTREWEHALIACVEAARAEGASIAAIAKAAGVTRQTIYRWLRGESRPRSASTRKALDDGLEALLVAGVGPATTADITSALRSNELAIKAARMVRGIRGLSRPINQLDEEPRALIQLGLTAGTAVMANPENPPKRIRMEGTV